jgi:hypothetical protein
MRLDQSDRLVRMARLPQSKLEAAREPLASYFMPARGYMRCPICKKVITWEGNPDRPFCSERCRLIDLGNWAAEEYSLPAGESETHENDEQPNSAET